MKKIIKDYEDYYIYDNGDVQNIKTGRFLKPTIDKNGYKFYTLFKDKKKKRIYAHRLVAENFLVNSGNLHYVIHKDGDRLNNNVDNLEWSYFRDNRP